LHFKLDFTAGRIYGTAATMAKPRIFIEEDSEAGVYHALSRAVDGNDIFADAEKETLPKRRPSSA